MARVLKFLLKLLTLSLYVMLFCGWQHRVLAEAYELEGGTSPNGKLVVRVETKHQKSGAIQLAYTIFEKQSDRALLSLACSYEPEEGELPNWSLNHAKAALVYWSSKSNLVAVDEDAHRYIGTVLVARVFRGGTVKKVFFPQTELVSISNQHWDRYRVHVSQGWTGRSRLSVELSGLLQGNTGAAQQDPATKTFAAIIDFHWLGHPQILPLKTQ